MSENNKVDLDWVRAQLTAVRARQGAGDAALQLLSLWETIELEPDMSKEAIELFSKLSLGHSLVPENPNEVWVQAIAGQISVGQQVRVKHDAFQGDQGRKLNGRRGNIVAIRTGRIVMKTTDGLKPELDGDHFRAEQLEVRIR